MNPQERLWGRLETIRGNWKFHFLSTTPIPLNMVEIQSLNFLLACVFLTMKYLGSYSFSGSFENMSKESNFGEIRTPPVKTAIYRGRGGGLLKRWNVP